MNNHYDLIIIGTGAGGGTLASKLAPTGKRILLLERGDLPAVKPPDPLAPGDTCHYMAPVRFGRRRSDQYGHLVLTGGWLKFRGTGDVSVSWSEVGSAKSRSAFSRFVTPRFYAKPASRSMPSQKSSTDFAFLRAR